MVRRLETSKTDFIKWSGMTASELRSMEIDQEICQRECIIIRTSTEFQMILTNFGINTTRFFNGVM